MIQLYRRSAPYFSESEVKMAPRPKRQSRESTIGEAPVVMSHLTTTNSKKRGTNTSSSHYYYRSFRRSAGQDARDLVMYRTWLKIKDLEESHFDVEKKNEHGRTENCDIRSYKGRLIQRGWTNRDIGDVGNDMEQSVRFEMKGDTLRTTGRWDEAMQEYTNALKVPIFSCARKDNPDVAFLWRKLACLTAIRQHFETALPIQFRVGMMDVVSRDKAWMEEFKDFIFIPALDSIMRGDTFYQECKYDRATFEYRRAVIIGKLCQVQRSTSNRWAQKPQHLPTRNFADITNSMKCVLESAKDKSLHCDS